MTNEERIKADAEAKYLGRSTYILANRNGYIAGATAVHDRAKVLVDALEEIIKNGENVRSTYKVSKPAFYIKIARIALEQWKGKEMEQPAKQIEYMPIHPDDAKKFDCPTQFPMYLLNEEQAMRNHSQTLESLKERGGLTVREILAIICKKPWSYYSDLTWPEALKMLNDIIITNPQK